MLIRSNFRLGNKILQYINLGTNTGISIYLETTKMYPLATPITPATIICNSLVYTGSNQLAQITSVTLDGDPLIEGTDYTISINNGGTDVGTYNVIIQGIGNYGNNSTGTFNITPATGSASISGVSLTYNGQARDLITVSDNTGTMHYRIGTTGEWSTTIPTATNAGSYTIYYYMDASLNYTAQGSSSSPWGSVSSSIGKADQEAPTAYGSTVTYGSTASAAASGGGGHGSIEWSNGSSRSAVGSQITSARWTGDNNCNGSTWSNSVTLTVNKANQSAPTAYGATVSYGSTATATASGGGGHGSIQWSNGNTRTAIGSQTTQARWSGDGNYNASSYSNSVTLQVNKANSSIYFSGNGSVTEGSTMTKAVTRSAGDGSISYSSSNTSIATVNSSGTVTGVAAGSCTITATIAATTNYNASSASYTLTVNHPTYNGYAYVDLGLSCKWAVCNVGASSETGYGNYYRGNTDNPRSVMGGNWRLPTKAQFEELINNCTCTWTSIGGVNGMKFSRNNRYVFFPAAGSASDASTVGQQGRYWSITEANTTPEYNRLYFDSSKVKADGQNPPRYEYPNRGIFT